MNERILKLAVEAGGGPSKWYTDSDVLEYFAELIVRECSNIVFEEGCTEDNPDCPNEELYQLSNKIERYFGVEL
jgi:hypothetical protein